MARPRKHPQPTRKLSTVEMTVLGFAWLRGPCTIYSIMKELSASESSYHKSRAGTAYSVANRLIGFGLIEEFSAEDSDERNVRVTKAGVKALQEWIGPPVPISDVAHSADLVRLRFFFLGAVSQERRLAFIDEAIDGLREFHARCEALLPANQEIGDYFGALATVSSILEAKARIEWLTIVRELVVSPLPPDQDWTEAILKRLAQLPTK